jgi:hypothetical protein
MKHICEYLLDLTTSHGRKSSPQAATASRLLTNQRRGISVGRVLTRPGSLRMTSYTRNEKIPLVERSGLDAGRGVPEACDDDLSDASRASNQGLVLSCEADDVPGFKIDDDDEAPRPPLTSK